jgi:hypothetical protein
MELPVSNFFGNTEVLFATGQAATTTTPAASAVNICATWPSIEFPPGFFANSVGKRASTGKLKMRGQMTTTATIPTWQFGVAWTQAMPAAFSATTVIAATAVRTPGTAQTGAWVDIELDVFLRTIALGAASVLVGSGSVRSEGLLPSVFSTTQVDEWSLPATGANGQTAASVDIDQPVFLWPYLTLGAATAGNTFTAQMGKLYGET